jgi:hypothetical protein
MKLVIRDVPEELWPSAINCAKQFIQEYPNRMGIHQCVIYGLTPMLIVYRTKTSIIVRGE